jgi:hypothetical protein
MSFKKFALGSHSILFAALALGGPVACGGGPAETAPGPWQIGGAAGTAGASAGGASSGGASSGGASSGGASSGGTAGAAGAAGAAGGGGAPNPNALRFENARCSYQVTGATTLVDGMPIECGFDVLGDPNRQVTLSCEDALGKPIDCSASSTGAQAVPFGPQPIPLVRGQLLDWASGMAGKTYSIVVVASDGVETAKHPLLIPIVADDGINVAPTIDFDCDGDTDGQVDVTAGETVSCHIVYYDPDPGTFEYSLQRTQGADPVNYVSTEVGAAYTSRELELSWQTDASEAGTSASYELGADDTVAPAVKKTIAIHVH